MDIFEELFGMPRKSVVLEEQLKVLEELGISCTSKKQLHEIQNEREYAEDAETAYIFVLECIGSEKPYSDKVYSFDSEASEPDIMYTEFMNRIQLLMQDEVSLAEIEETFDDEEGMHGVKFTYNGHTYAFDAEDQGDWMDCSIIGFVNDVLEKENNEKRLLCMVNNSQGFIKEIAKGLLGLLEDEVIAQKTGLSIEQVRAMHQS